MCSWGSATCERTLGRDDAARAAYDEALTLYKQADNRLGQANVQRGLGDLERGLGRKDAARAAYAVAAELLGEVGLTEWQKGRLGQNCASLMDDLTIVEARRSEWLKGLCPVH